MKLLKIKTLCALLAATGTLMACGGGGDDEAGSSTTFTTVPTSTTFTAPAGTAADTCVGGGTSTVFIYGGSAPYQINNTVPAYVAVDKTQVGERGGNFTVTALGGCLTTGSIVIKDKLDHIVTFTVDNQPAT